jgi:hypothetical protein
VTREEKRIKTIEKRRAVLLNILKDTARYPGVVIDDEALAAYWVGPWQRWNHTAENALQIYLNLRPRTGYRHRLVGRVLPDGILECWRDDSKGTLHWHPKLECWTIARYAILNAARFGFHAVRVNAEQVITVDELLAAPEVPKEERGPYERQLQILGKLRS